MKNPWKKFKAELKKLNMIEITVDSERNAVKMENKTYRSINIMYNWKLVTLNPLDTLTIEFPLPEAENDQAEG